VHDAGGNDAAEADAHRAVAAGVETVAHLVLLDELVNRQDFFSAYLEPFSAAALDSLTASFQDTVDRALKSAAVICFDLNVENGFVRCARANLSGNSLHRVRLGGTNL
jgi:hypothetical protein